MKGKISKVHTIKNPTKGIHKPLNATNLHIKFNNLTDSLIYNIDVLLKIIKN